MSYEYFHFISILMVLFFIFQFPPSYFSIVFYSVEIINYVGSYLLYVDNNCFITISKKNYCIIQNNNKNKEKRRKVGNRSAVQ